LRANAFINSRRELRQQRPTQRKTISQKFEQKTVLAGNT
jgi:hypothetical protein